MLQSRRTVAGDTLSTSAVSSTLSPPKKRISMIMHFPWIEMGQRVQGVIERHQVRGPITTDNSDLFQSDMRHTRPALYVMAARMINQNAPHHLGRHRKEVCAILPLHALILHQSHVGVIDQSSRLEGVAGALAFHIAMSQAAEFIINDGGQPLQRALVSIAPGTKQRAYVFCIQLGRHFTPAAATTGLYRPPLFEDFRVVVSNSSPILRLVRVEEVMKTILTSIAAGSLLALLAAAQTPRSAVDRSRVFGQPEIQAASTNAAPYDRPASASHSRLVYVITGSSQFGAVDLNSGTFLPIGPDLPPEVGGGLVQGPGKPLLTLGFSGDLLAINPATGISSVVGQTGLGDCTTPASPCGPESANGIGRLDEKFYATDFANNLYSLNPRSGAARLIGLTGIPALPFSPLSVNPDGSQNVFNETLFSAHGKLYANFAAAVRPQGGPPVVVIPPAIWEINPKTGHAKWIAPTELGLTSIVNVKETIYAFSVRTGQVVILDVSTGQTSAVSDLDPAAGLIGGAAPAQPSRAAKE